MLFWTKYAFYNNQELLYWTIEISQFNKYEQNADLLVSSCKSNDLYTVPCAANNQLIAVTWYI